MRKVSPLLTLKEKERSPGPVVSISTVILPLPKALSRPSWRFCLTCSWRLPFEGSISPKVKVLVWPLRVTVKLLPERYSALVASSFTTFSVVLRVKLEVPSASAEVTRFLRSPVAPLKWTLLPAPFLSLRVTVPLLSTLTSMRVSALTWSPLLVVIFCSFSLSWRAVWNLAVSRVPSALLNNSNSPKSSVTFLLPYSKVREPLMVLSGCFSPSLTGSPFPRDVSSPEASWVYRAASASCFTALSTMVLLLLPVALTRSA